MKGPSPSLAGRIALRCNGWGFRFTSTACHEGTFASEMVTIGIDLAENLFAIHGAGATDPPNRFGPSRAPSNATEVHRFAALPQWKLARAP